jgi:4-hydroxy-tetrahydrodipicolinate reductase
MALNVVVSGANGRMGQMAVHCLERDDRFCVVGKITRTNSHELETIFANVQVDVLLELSTGHSATGFALSALKHGVSVVIGSTGMCADDLAQLEAESAKKAIFLVPNFAIGAVLMMHFASQAAKWFGSVEIIERHHEKKLDAPSGTSIRTAEMISKANSNLTNIPIHSVRLPGHLAHQEVIFGGYGEVLTIKHDSSDRSSFEAGIKLALLNVGQMSGFVVGLEHLLAP